LGKVLEKLGGESEMTKDTRKHHGRKVEFNTLSGLNVKSVYTSDDMIDQDYAKMLGSPGEYPYTRGIHEAMYRGRIWTMRQLSGFGVSEDTKERIRFLTEQGQSAPSLIFDAPTRWDYDSNHPMAKGAVGRVGSPLDTLKDLEDLLEGSSLENIHFTESAIAFIVLSMLIAISEKRGIPIKNLKGTVQNDILKEYSGPCMYIISPEHALKIVTDIIKFCGEAMPLFNPISISCTTLREAGANAIQELGFWMAHSIAYIQACINKGLNIDEFAPKLTSFFGCHHDFFEEIAKFRAARRMWAKVLKERFEATDPKSLMLKFHVQTSGSALTTQQPLNNITRGALESLAAVLGGAQSVGLSCYDEGLGIPTEQSIMTALRTQQIIAYESNVTNTVDPLGGSYFLENLTVSMEEEAFKYVEKIDEMGGAVEAIKNGFILTEINKQAQYQQEAIEKGEIIVVGVNKFQMEESSPTDIIEIPPEVEIKQTAKLSRIKKERNREEVNKVLNGLRETLKNGGNIIPPTVEAVKAHATVGEICDILRKSFGTYHPKIL